MRLFINVWVFLCGESDSRSHNKYFTVGRGTRFTLKVKQRLKIYQYLYFVLQNIT